MTNGEGLPPAWMNDDGIAEYNTVPEECVECGIAIPYDERYCEEHRPSRYFTMG